MTTSQPPRALAPLPIRPAPQRGDTTESYARRLARANHLKPSYLRSVLSSPPQRLGAAIRPSQLAALSGRSLRALEHALTDLATQPRPEPQQTDRQHQPAPARRARVGISARPLISTWLLSNPQLTATQIWERLLDEHDADISYTTVLHYRRTMTSRARFNGSARPKTP